MKKLFVILVLLIPFALVNAQENKSRKERKAEKELQKKEKIKNLIDSQSFVFSASHALPMGGSSIALNHYFNAKIEGDSVYSYLPYYGVAYSAQYGQNKSPFNFDKPMEDYSVEKEKDGYLIKFDTKNGNDYINYTIRVSESGYASLNITSTNRQSISFTGIIEPVENDI
ncbi:DUF4251 domain-containing protein [Maribellus comscasis]|uniref:DUF4251 domain-containing protein n=1 Tax=Maribellus comscasis TaxID=2681766 RepID=A0A6I6K2K6_9BACT|nr:DUF4251 domain-containing protein [Maribellus comscasis]QGY47899.1 DUF4251 domain-containing protein [Maribellus comscasis]